MSIGIGIVGLVCLVLLMFQRWFWIVFFGISSVASCLALLASIIHFEILGALAYSCLMLVCWSIAKAVANGYPPAKEERAQEMPPSPRADGPDWSPP